MLGFPEPAIYKRFDNWLAGKPDTVLTFLLLAGAVILVIVALQPSRVLKAAVVAWEVLP